MLTLVWFCSNAVLVLYGSYRGFFRISRAAIVNLDAVREVAPTAGGHGEVTLRDGSKYEVSRRRFKELTETLGA